MQNIYLKVHAAYTFLAEKLKAGFKVALLLGILPIKVQNLGSMFWLQLYIVLIFKAFDPGKKFI